MANNTDLHLRVSAPFSIEDLQRNSTLDNAQATALVDCLRRQIGLIQGPPGTGKSYTGVAIIKVLLQNKERLPQGLSRADARGNFVSQAGQNAKADIGPIICVTYTNHALDQLLQDLLDNNTTSQIIRIGSRSKSARLEDFNFSVVSRDADKTKTGKGYQWSSKRNLEQDDRVRSAEVGQRHLPVPSPKSSFGVSPWSLQTNILRG